MDVNGVVDLSKRSAAYIVHDENLLISGKKITGKERGAKVLDQWEGEDGFMAKKVEMNGIVKERWDQEDDEMEDTDSKAPRRPESVVRMYVENGDERAMDCKQQDIGVEEKMKENADTEKQKPAERNDTLKKKDKQGLRMEELSKFLLRRENKRRKRRRRPYVKKTDDSEVLHVHVAPRNEKNGEMDRVGKSDHVKLEKELSESSELTPITEKKPSQLEEISLKKEADEEDLRNTEEPSTDWEEKTELRSTDNNDGKLGSDSGHSTAAADDDKDVTEDEDDEEDDDFFIPRKLFFFSFTHFKGEEHDTKRA